MSRFGFVIALLLALGALKPQVASATCGDWLVHPETELTRVELGNAQEASKSPDTPRRCTGPLCGQSPMGPIPSPADPATERYHQPSAFLVGQSGGELSLDDRSVSELDLLLLSGNPLSIDRPPKS